MKFKITLFRLGIGLTRPRFSGIGGDTFRFLPICGGVRLAAANKKLKNKCKKTEQKK